MSIITPDSELKLYRDVDITDEKHLIFQSAQEREAYFASHLFRSNVDFSYMKIGEPITLELSMADAYNFNYISFRNKSFENKIIYARCQVVPDYVNNEVVKIIYDVDRFTTWMFDVEFEDCEVEREHLGVGDKQIEDTNPWRSEIGAEFTPEPLSFDISVKAKRTSDTTRFIPIMDFEAVSNFLQPQFCVITSQDIDDSTEESTTPPPHILDGANFASVCSYRFNAFSSDASNLEALQRFIEKYNTNGAISSILGVYILPLAFAYAAQHEGTYLITHYVPEYTPNSIHNRKLWRYPYNYLRVTDPVGNSKEYRYEKFSSTPQFGVFYTINGYPQIVLAPFMYDMEADPNVQYDNNDPANYNFDEKMIFTDFPQVAYNTDGFLTYLGNMLRGQIVKDSTAAPWAYDYGRYALGAFGTGAEALVKTGADMYSGKGGAVAGDMLSSVGLGMRLEDMGWRWNVNETLHGTAQEFVAGQNTPTVIPDILKNVIPACVNDDYHGGSGSVASLSAYQFNRVGFYVECVHPYDSLMEKYDKFLDAYGYNVFRIGVPRIAYYTGANQGTADDMPTFNDKNRTFVKTINCHVKSSNMWVAKGVEALLNGGHWFEKVVSNG